MTATEPVAQEHDQPPARTVRFWLGLLVLVLVCMQVGATVWAYEAWSGTRADHPEAIRLCWQRFTLALASASLAMMCVIGGAGLIMNFQWARRVIVAGAVLQILLTVAMQFWEAAVTVTPEGYPPGRGLMAAFIGIIFWNIIPVGILFLTLAGRAKQAKQ